MFWRKLNRNWVREILWPFKRFYTGVKRLIEFTPIIWNSYDWDYVYSVDLFKFQLLRMADYFDKYGHLENNRYNARRIRTICKLMDRTYNEYYIDSAYDSLMEKYGKEAFEFETVSDDNGKRTFQQKYESYPNASEIEEERSKSFKIAIKKQEKAHKLLWKLIEHDIQRWWD
jgi:hypothetical protein